MSTIYFEPVDIALAFFGLRMNIKTNRSKWFNQIWFTTVISLNTIQAIIVTFYSSFAISKDLQWLGYILPYVLSIVLKLYIRWRSRQIVESVTNVDRLLNTAQRHQLRNQSTRYIIGFLLTWMIYVIADVLYSISSNSLQQLWLPTCLTTDESNWTKSLLAVVLMADDMFLVFSTIYLSGALYLLMVSLMRHLTLGFYTLCLQVDMKRTIVYGDKLVDIYRTFNNIFDISPLVWVINVYVLTSGSIVFSLKQTGSAQDSPNISLLADFLSLIACVIYFTTILLIAASIVKTINEEKKLVIRKLSYHGLGQSMNIHYLISSIDTIDFKLTGQGLFKIERSMILHLFGSLITFSILFAQITGSKVLK